MAMPATALALIACAATNPTPNRPRVAGAPSTDEQPTSVAFSHTSSGSSGDNSPSKSVSGVARRSGEPPVAGDAIEITDFCSEHGIVANLKNIERCVSTPLGTRSDDQLWCSRRDELDDNRVVYYLALYRVQGKRLAKVTEFPYAAGPKPLAEHENDFMFYVKLLPEISGDAKSFEVREEANLGCDEGLKRVREEFTVYPDLEKPIEQLVQRVCSARGKFSANGQRLNR